MNFKKYKKTIGLLTLSASVAFLGTVRTEATNEYKLNNSVNIYLNAQNAKNKSKSVGKYESGTYYIYKKSNGMINISKNRNGAGAWINPSDNANYTSRKVSTSSGKYRLNNPVKVFNTAADAKNNRRAISTYSSGQYYIYKTYNGMLNLSKTKGKPGGWINPNDNKISTSVEKKPSTNTSTKKPSTNTRTPKGNISTNKGDVYKLNNSVRTYSTANNAKNRRGAVSTYSKGNYYVFRSYNGMLNISRVKGKVGAWINPNDNKISSPVKTKPNTNTSTKKPSTNTRTPKGNISTNKGDVYKLNNSVRTYSTANNAKNKIRSISKYEKGNYYVFRSYNGMLNISKIKGQPGGWINPSDNKVNSVVTKPTVENKPEKNDVFEEETKDIIDKTEDIIENNKNNMDDNKFNLDNPTKGYKTALDAENEKNSSTVYDVGSYYIYKKYKGMINISTIEGKPGAWINPGNLISNPDSNEKESPEELYNGIFIESKLPQITYYNVYNELDAYKTSNEALLNLGSDLKLESGKYLIYEYNDNMLNLTTDLNTPGVWINPNHNNTSNRIKPEADVNAFINKIGPVAKELVKDSDVYASVMIAQTILETGYGTSELSSENYNNFFGVKGNYNGQSAAIHTYEYRKDGSRYSVIAPFKSYDAVEQSLADYVRLITGDDNPNSWRYKFYYGARRSQTSSYKEAARYLTGRYATSPTYGDVLIGLIEKYDLTKYDPVEYRSEKENVVEKKSSPEETTKKTIIETDEDAKK